MILSLTDERIVRKGFEDKLNYLLKLRYHGELITLTIHVTTLTYLILILLYILMKVLEMEYHCLYIPITLTVQFTTHEKINRCLTNINRCLTNIFKIQSILADI